MPIPVHRHTDARVCGATTTVAGNVDVFANNLLVSVDADPNTHGGGALIAHSNQVFADNILSVNHTADTANPDALCPVPPHCNPDTDQGSPNVFTGDPSAAPTVVIPPAIIEKISLKIEVYIAEPYIPPPGYIPTPNEVEQNEIHFADTPDEPEAIGEVIAKPEDKVYEDICHPFDGLLDQHLLESSQDLWDETGMGKKYVGTYPAGAFQGDGLSNEKILGLWQEIGFRDQTPIHSSDWVWKTDQTAWCMGYVCYVLKLAGYKWLQTSRALDAKDQQAKFEFTEIPYSNWADAKCGDVCLWAITDKKGKVGHHVNFLYTNKNKKMSFVGGNQSDAARNTNNPSGGAVTHSWRGTAKSTYNLQGVEGGLGAYDYTGVHHDTNLIHIYRPKKV